MLYFPWYDESTDLLGGYSTYEEHYRHVCSIVLNNESKYTEADVGDLEVDENGPPEQYGVRLLLLPKKADHIP